MCLKKKKVGDARKAQKEVTSCLGRERGFLVVTELQEMPRIGYYMFRSRHGIPGRDRVRSWFRVAIRIPVSRHGSQILSNETCRNMAFFIATGVLVLCRDRGFLIATKTVTTRGRGCDRAWLRPGGFVS